MIEDTPQKTTRETTEKANKNKFYEKSFNFKLLCNFGLAYIGSSWKTGLADDLRMSRVSLSRMAKGEQFISAGVASDLLLLADKRIAALKNIKKDIEKEIQSLKKSNNIN